MEIGTFRPSILDISNMFIKIINNWLLNKYCKCDNSGKKIQHIEFSKLKFADESTALYIIQKKYYQIESRRQFKSNAIWLRTLGKML